MKKIINTLKLFLGWPLSLIAIFFIAQKVLPRIQTISTRLEEINFQLLFYGILSFLMYFFLRSYLWKLILKEKGHNIPFKESVYLWGISELKRFVPGNIWSFLGRTILYSEKGISKRTIMSAILTEVQLFLLSCIILSLFALSFILYNLFADFSYTNILLYIIYALSALISIVYIYSNSLADRFFTDNFFSFIRPLFPRFSPSVISRLFAISLLYVFFFGIGTYFTASSITFLTPVYIFTFIGLFVFSLLAGYLSIITPMGLGVREGIITLGLSKFIPLSLAGLASIYVRVVLIFSELIFLVFSYFWMKTKSPVLIKAQSYILGHKHEAFLAASIAIYIIFFTNLSFLRYDNFYTGRFDLGNMDQTVWNTLQGRFFQLTDPDGTEIISRLGIHADFILVLIAPFYALWPSAKMLLLIQTIVLGSGAIFVYLISKQILRNSNISLLFSTVYLLNPSVQYANLYDFHGVALATTFLLAAFYFLIKEKYYLFLLAAILAAVTKEEVWLITSLFGVYIFFNTFFGQQKEKANRFAKQLLGISIFLVSLAAFYYLVTSLIPSVRGATHFALSYYSDFGTSPSSIVKNMVFSPQKTIAILSQGNRLYYLYQLFAPVGFLPVFSPFALVFAVPDFAINLLSNNSQLQQIYFHYNSAIVPFVLISSVYGLKRLNKMYPKVHFNIYSLFLIGTTLYSVYFFGPLPGAKNPNLDMVIKSQPDREAIDNFISRIPQEYSVAATNNLGSHLSQREKIYTIPVGIDKADIILFLLNDQFAQPSLPKQREMAENLKQDRNYVEVFSKNDFVVFEKKKTGY